MAPTSKSTSATGTNANPAPDFTVNMNRIQTQLEARLKAVRSFLPSRSELNNASAKPGSGSFSALNANSPSSSSGPQSQSAAAAARRQAEEAEFAEDRGLDPNAGIGLARAPAGNGGEGGRDRDTARLRGRLLGKRGKSGVVDTDGQQRWVRKEESSDEEAGRSGLGRSKRRKGKRSQVEDDDGIGLETNFRIRDMSSRDTAPAAENRSEQVEPADIPEGDTEDLAPKPAGEDEASVPTIERSPNSPKKRRKRKKKRAKDKLNEN
ncbi:hypothetical protein F4804DRAFT_329923 [Jackrogersella minutella]|nr:hypothetical protein F4804DRAFT_329923 [Jackrogersella minutella]